MKRKCYIDPGQASTQSSGALLSLPECELLPSPGLIDAAQLMRLVCAPAGWHFCLPGDGARVALDYARPAFARRLAPNNLRAEYVVRAVWGRLARSASEKMLVLDATAGVGADSFLLAASGCEVIQVERIPVLASLLQLALLAAQDSAEPNIAAAAQRVRVIKGDSIALMRGWQGAQPAVVYLDPMYAEPGAQAVKGLKPSAAVKKNMRALQLLSEIYHDNYSDSYPDNYPDSYPDKYPDKFLENHPAQGAEPGDRSLLSAACELATTRVVVKMAPAAPPLAGRKPSSCLAGKAARFDVYAL